MDQKNIILLCVALLYLSARGRSVILKEGKYLVLI